MVDIKPAAAEIRRGKKEDRRQKEEDRKKLQGKNIIAPPPYYIGRPLIV